jgi:hypothetical protein
VQAVFRHRQPDKDVTLVPKGVHDLRGRLGPLVEPVGKDEQRTETDAEDPFPLFEPVEVGLGNPVLPRRLALVGPGGPTAALDVDEPIRNAARLASSTATYGICLLRR